MRNLTLSVLFSLLTVATGLAAPFDDGKLDDVILFDSSCNDASLDEALARQRLGLLDAQGKPLMKDGKPLPLKSKDGKKAAFDMKSTKCAEAMKCLKECDGTLIVITHGWAGEIKLDGQKVAGFGKGTSHKTAKPPKPINRKLKNLTVHMVVCKAAASNPLVDSVEDTFVDGVESAGGSIKKIDASERNCYVTPRLNTCPAWSSVPLAKKKLIFKEMRAKNIKGSKVQEHFPIIQGAFDKVMGKNKLQLKKITYIGKIPGKASIQGESDEFDAGTEGSSTLHPSTPVISAASGGAQHLDLFAGTEQRGRLFLLLGTMSGIEPGLPIGVGGLPLNPDPYFWFMAGNPNSVVVPSVGLLSPSGHAKATFHLPPGLLALRGEEFHHAYMVFDLKALSVSMTSGPALLTIID